MLLDTNKIKLSSFDIKRKIELPSKIDENLSEFCGIHIADGYMVHKPKQRHYLIRWGGNPKDEKDYYNKHITKLWLDLFNAKIKPRLYDNGTYGFEFYSKGIFEFLTKCMGIPAGSKVKIASIPLIIRDTCQTNVSKKMIGFLRGVIDNDFYLIKDKNGLELGGWFASKDLVKDLYESFIKLELHPKVRSDTKYFDKRLKKWIVRYCVRIRRKDDIRKWFKLIGTNNFKLYNRYENWANGCSRT